MRHNIACMYTQTIKWIIKWKSSKIKLTYKFGFIEKYILDINNAIITWSFIGGLVSSSTELYGIQWIIFTPTCKHIYSKASDIIYFPRNIHVFIYGTRLFKCRTLVWTEILWAAIVCLNCFTEEIERTEYSHSANKEK